jgi:diacylglycerol kinase family enzyme
MTRIRHVEVVANCASGSVGEAAPAHAEAILAEFGVKTRVHAARPDTIAQSLRDAVAAGPDLLVILAGDGTARAAAELCGPEGPLLAPLAGGTMNMLPHAVYGHRSWQEALTLALRAGVPRPIGGGEVDGRSFLVAAILGAPALWAPAREAARMGKPGLALRRMRRAVHRAFSGRLRYCLDGSEREKAEALVFMCPLTSRAMPDDEQALEAGALDPAGAAEAFRLGLHAVLGDWRDDPAVNVRRCRMARVWAAGGVPAILDGEWARLKPHAEVRFRPKVVRLLALPRDAPV